jgi:hypothetical protein
MRAGGARSVATKRRARERGGTPVPDADTIRAARARRDLGWSLIRRSRFEGEALDGDIAHRDESGAFRPAFSDLPPLEVSRKYDPELPAHLFPLMHVTERPIVIIIFGAQRFERGRRIVVVAGPPGQRGMHATNRH